jgi:hypothetical protein
MPARMSSSSRAVPGRDLRSLNRTVVAPRGRSHQPGPDPALGRCVLPRFASPAWRDRVTWRRCQPGSTPGSFAGATDDKRRDAPKRNPVSTDGSKRMHSSATQHQAVRCSRVWMVVPPARQGVATWLATPAFWAGPAWTRSTASVGTSIAPTRARTTGRRSAAPSQSFNTGARRGRSPRLAD